MGKALARIPIKKIKAYPKLSKYFYRNGQKELQYMHRVCDKCKDEYLTQLESENFCPNCNKDFDIATLKT